MIIPTDLTTGRILLSDDSIVWKNTNLIFSKLVAHGQFHWYKFQQILFFEIPLYELLVKVLLIYNHLRNKELWICHSVVKSKFQWNFASCEVPLRNEISLLCDTKLCMHHCIDMPMSSALALALQYFSWGQVRAVGGIWQFWQGVYSLIWCRLSIFISSYVPTYNKEATPENKGIL